MKILNLTLMKKWYDMELSGEKPEEYREIKPYWMKRLIVDYYKSLSPWAVANLATPNNFFKHFDAIRYTNGYGKNAPSFMRECKGIEIAEGEPKWGAIPDVKYFVLKNGILITQ